jgi:hypothetical protein
MEIEPERNREETMLSWINRLYCGLHGHDNLMHFDKDRMFLQCVSCGHETPGWTLSSKRPRMIAQAPARPHGIARPQLANYRRVA